MGCLQSGILRHGDFAFGGVVEVGAVLRLDGVVSVGIGKDAERVVVGTALDIVAAMTRVVGPLMAAVGLQIAGVEEEVAVVVNGGERGFDAVCSCHDSRAPRASGCDEPAGGAVADVVGAGGGRVAMISDTTFSYSYSPMILREPIP